MTCVRAFSSPPLVTPELVFKKQRTGESHTSNLCPNGCRDAPDIDGARTHISLPLMRPPSTPALRCAVRLHLDDPLIATVDLAKLVSLCAIADAAIERVQKLPQTAGAFDVSLLQQIEAMCKQVTTKEPAQVRPHAATCLGRDAPFAAWRMGSMATRAAGKQGPANGPAQLPCITHIAHGEEADTAPHKGAIDAYPSSIVFETRPILCP